MTHHGMDTAILIGRDLLQLLFCLDIGAESQLLAAILNKGPEAFGSCFEMELQPDRLSTDLKGLVFAPATFC